MKLLFLTFFLIVVCKVSYASDTLRIASPNGKVGISFFAGEERRNDLPSYEVRFENKPFLRPSALGLELSGQSPMTVGFKVISSQVNYYNRTWSPLYGERLSYEDNYAELNVRLQETLAPFRKLDMVFRAYNEGIAFCYRIPRQIGVRNISITKELTQFNFLPGAVCWEEHGHEGNYQKTPLTAIHPDCELPLTIKTGNDLWGVIADAGNASYPRAYLRYDSLRNVKTDRLSMSLRGEARQELPYQTEWRMLTISDRLEDMIEHNYLILNLNDENRIKNADWIKPGKAIRDPNMSTISCKKYIDYAAANGLQYVIIDWGWYGAPNSDFSEPTRVNVVNPSTGKAIPGHSGLSIPEVVKYGKEHGIGIWLYVNRQGLERYSEKAFIQFQKWGIAGVKPGFIRVGNQEWQDWVSDLVKKAAKYHLMLDIHDAYRPTGLSRTYPNLMTQEGVQGNEHAPDADHDVLLPFVRYTIGAADYTPGYCKAGLKNTWCHRLALPFLYYSPVQFLFWGEQLSDCHQRPELELWRGMPTVWDETKVLAVDPGEYIVMARRSGDDWYIGGITNHKARNIGVSFDFLSDDTDRTATLYNDADGDVVKITTISVKKTSALTIPVNASGGFALKITPRQLGTSKL